MSLTSFTIQFDNPLATYFTGQLVTGRVCIRLSKQKTLRNIELKCAGKSSVYWTEEITVHENGKSHKETGHYNAHEMYFQNNFFLLGGPSGETTLPRGEHTYPFQIILPPVIPSSFEGEFGHVRYTAKAIISRPWRFDHECKVAFTVINPLDLNLQPNVQTPFQHTEEKTLCCCCCRSPPIALVISLPFTGLVPGQICRAVVETDNPTDEAVRVKCSLVQEVTFTAYHGHTMATKVVRNVIAVHRVGQVNRRSSITTAVDLNIPALPTSFLTNCTNIDISYKLEVIGALAGCHTDMNVTVPIVIGTIPLRAQMSSLAGAALDGPSEAAAPSAPPAPFGDYPGMPPPTYEECMSGRKNIRSADDNEYVQGPLEFAPRYPTYAFK